MRKSLLQVVQAVTGELKINIPTVVISSSDTEIQKIYALVVAACDELAQRHDWEQLMFTSSFTTVAGQTAYPLPSDFLRLVDNTLWNKTTTRPVYGPESPEQWARLTRGVVTSGPTMMFRLQGNNFTFVPTPGEADQIIFDYISAAYVIDAGTSAQKLAFQSDADLCVFDDRLLIDFVKLKYLETNGFDTSAVFSDYMLSLDNAKPSNTAGATLSMRGGYTREALISIANVRDGNLGGV